MYEVNDFLVPIVLLDVILSICFGVSNAIILSGAATVVSSALDEGAALLHGVFIICTSSCFGRSFAVLHLLAV